MEKLVKHYLYYTNILQYLPPDHQYHGPAVKQMDHAAHGQDIFLGWKMYQRRWVSFYSVLDLPERFFLAL